MTTAYSSLLGLALPVQGELAGQWGDTVNDYITKYLDASIAGSLSITADVTLTKTTGTTLGATSSQYAILTCSPSSVNIVVTAPAAYKIYVVNNTSASYTVTIRGAGPTTGVVLAALEKAVVAWNGSDFFKVATSATDGVTTFSAGSTGLTPSSATAGAVTLAGTLAVANGGTGITSFGTGVATALGVNTGSAGAFVVNGGVLGTPASGTVTNLTGTASININGTVGATTPAAGTFTSVSAGSGAISGGAITGTANAAFGTATAPAWSVVGVVTAGPYGTYYSETNASSVVTNAYYAGGAWKYRNTNPATRIDSYNGDHYFYTAPSGTADAAVTFTERARITSTGLNSTVIGATTPAAGSFTTLSTTGAVGLTLAADTAVRSTGNIYYDAGTSGTGNHIFRQGSGYETRITINGTGAAVTGTLSASGETLIGGAQTLGAGLGVKNASATSTTTGDNKIIRLAANASGADVTLSFTDAISYNSNISAKANHLLLQPVAGTVVGDFSSTGLAVTGTLSATQSAQDAYIATFVGTTAVSGHSYGVRIDAGTTADDWPLLLRSKAGTDLFKVDGTGLVTLPIGQIKFPATQNASSNANTLDDYEEGTWTPQLGDGTNTVSGTTTCVYRKVGGLVWVTFEIYNKNISGFGAGQLRLANLPFAMNSATTYATFFGSTTAISNISASGSNGNVYAVLYQGFSTSDFVNLTKAAFTSQNNMSFYGSFCYSAD